ncbi:MAG: DUF4249 domain-containing protein [Bacteroidia bacterium]|nr:DUF4249 domain-containing protein [Bacteroidia bacterium]
MKYSKSILFLIITLAGCVSEYIPGLKVNEEMLVVEGLITDQPGVNTIKIYKTLPIWTRDFRTDLKETTVWISDDQGRIDLLRQAEVGTFCTDPATFRGIPGRKYTLHFKTWTIDGYRNYESLPMEMIPVPVIDTIYYEKRNYIYDHLPAEGCQIYMDTHDPLDSCKFYRWNYSETWEFRLPFLDVTNRICWISAASNEILIKNASIFSEDRIIRYPLKLITNPVDRFGFKYSLQVTQYSLNEDEYYYWERLQNSIKQVGGLYDIIPSTIPGNIFCNEDNLEKVLGYFSVSAVKSKRFYIKDYFVGRNAMYVDCVDSISYGINAFAGDNSSWWQLWDFTDSIPPRRILTNRRVCGDCTSRGTNVRPDFWDDDK